jgi:la-related protein 1
VSGGEERDLALQDFTRLETCTMSATIGKGPERSPGLQPFSYAEAAKGRTIPIPSPQQPVEAPAKSPANPTEERRPSAHTIPTTNGIESPGSTNIQDDTSKAVEISHESEDPQSPNDHDNTSTTASTITSPALPTKTQEPKRATSGTSSPSFGTASTSTLPKEDDISFTPNGSSDSTWDKQSQVSNSAEKSTQTGETSEEKVSEGTWETTATGFKELKAAPIPSVNIWAQRKAAQDAKAKGNAKPTPAPLSIGTSTKSGSPNLPPTLDDPTPDQIKPGFKKRGPVPAKSTEDSSTQQRQDRRRATDGGKPRDDGNFCFQSLLLFPQLTNCRS